ncbi:hypothetical protein B6D60_01045 [candidate division KSB1 bacterium 4484_87]|nr:MAG: hypothetical protein B6D60_01045 [candidate division KSB1 bacterium 4484_87]
MKFIADLHIHSRFSRATSRDLSPEALYKWAQIKGIAVVGTGDVTHPGWLGELEEKLEPAEEGLYKLKEGIARKVDAEIPAACRKPVRFILTGEISNIYKKEDRVRKNHNVVFLPSFEVAHKFQEALEKIGNIRSDGRPILGLDARNLLEMTLESDELSFLIPAHIWTPWFSLLGSKSGFDSVEECFEDLTEHIFALETGLSSDPPMNWRLSKLDRYVLVSNSDAHSAAKLGREANIFDCEFSFSEMRNALKDRDSGKFLGTIEFFPEEGKYHLDGHRKCGVRLTPKETIEANGICPVCGKKLTLGVLYRVEELADRPDGSKPEYALPFLSLIPLPEILSQILNVGPNTKTVQQKFNKLLAHLGSEIDILSEIPLAEIEKVGGTLLAEGIRRMREGQVTRIGGFDGEFGKIQLFDEKERAEFTTGAMFFQEEEIPTQKETPQPLEKVSLVKDEEEKYEPEKNLAEDKISEVKYVDDAEDSEGLNPQQREAVEFDGKYLLIAAGPGTGKTRTLTRRIVHLIKEKNVNSENVLAVTFTNRAAAEMQERLALWLEPEIAKQLTIKTFHALGALILRQEAIRLGYKPDFSIYGEDEKTQLISQIASHLSRGEKNELADFISSEKMSLKFGEKNEDEKDELREKWEELAEKYQRALKERNGFDFDDLIFQPVKLLRNAPEVKKFYQNKFQYIFVDEYQDINFAQYALLRELTSEETHLCAIGDPDQAIYGFRGSDRKFFLQFEQDFPGTKVLHLEKNYRSDSAILKASAQVIEKNEDHQPLRIWSNLVSKTQIDIFETPTEKSEAETIVHQIEKMVGATGFFSVDSGRAGYEESAGAAGFSDIAVLYRINAQLPPLEEAFLRSGMPYQTFGDKPFYEMTEVKELLSFFRVIHNPHSDLDLMKIVNLPPRGIGEQTLKTLVNYQHLNEISLFQAMERCHFIAPLSETQRHPVIKFVEQLNSLRQSSQTLTLPELGERILADFSLKKFIKNDRKRQFFYEKLLARIKEFDGSLADFLEAVALHRETDEYDPRAEKVSLMTLHAAKGLEFSVVFIPGCEEDLIPFRRKNDESADVAEERRLFYVGMTRAKKRLILLRARSRYLFGERRSAKPSRFLNDIERALKAFKQAEIKDKPKKKSDPDSGQIELF